jgi:hypothetical protein
LAGKTISADKTMLATITIDAILKVAQTLDDMDNNKKEAKEKA